MTFIATDFVPRRFLSNAHLQTVLGSLLPRTNSLPPAEAQLVEVWPAQGSQIASQVLCQCYWQLDKVRPTVILVHGLEGSAASQYMTGNANKLFRAGANVILMNMRNCGGTEALTPTLYHSGLSGDVLAVMRYFIGRYSLQQVSLIGYSMGGNLVLKLAGDLGDDAPPELCAVVGVSPAVDLGTCADALNQPSNRLYEHRFLQALLKRYRRKTVLFPRVYDPNRAAGIRSVREFDERITALYSGFSGADDYYFRAASARVLERIAVPTLVLHALDDPFVVLTPESRRKIHENAAITFVETAHGGHCAFLAKANWAANDDGYWAETTALHFILDRLSGLR